MSNITNIKIFRESLKITQVELAKTLNVSQSTIAMWETGESYPRADKLPEIAKALNCTINDLYQK